MRVSLMWGLLVPWVYVDADGVEENGEWSEYKDEATWPVNAQLGRADKIIRDCSAICIEGIRWAFCHFFRFFDMLTCRSINNSIKIEANLENKLILLQTCAIKWAYPVVLKLVSCLPCLLNLNGLFSILISAFEKVNLIAISSARDEN